MIDRRFVATALALAATFLCGFILGEFIVLMNHIARYERRSASGTPEGEL